ncbi:hypothetical protein [Pectobacterium brasiliense]|uniref:hypothetical protein n=1 Tax=Pectobacterium brasiliense TaxID=180957 RepID=UPI000AE2C6FA|nr:hypothetical protein [Pectobacterium brasiliense]
MSERFIFATFTALNMPFRHDAGRDGVRRVKACTSRAFTCGVRRVNSISQKLLICVARTHRRAFPPRETEQAGVITLPDGTVIAVETERHLQTKARYQEIITQHLITRTQKLWMYVFYIVPDPQIKRAIERMFNGVKYAIVNRQHIRLEARHRDVFRVYTFEELKG